MARRVSTAGPGHPILTEVYLGSQLDAGAGQFLRLFNPSRAPIRLDGWAVGDGTTWATFPPGAMLPPGLSFYLARDPLAFTQAMGLPPDLIWGGTAGAAPPEANWMTGGEGLQLPAGGGWIGLRDAAGKVVDAVVWGDLPGGRPGQSGWQGEPVPLPKSGEILDRARTEGSILGGAAPVYQPDTDTAADWKQGATWLDERANRPGQTWFGAPLFRPGRVTVYSTPDSTYNVLTEAIGGAQESIDFEIYDFSLVQLTEQVVAAVKRGVKVRLLIEAGTVAGLYDQERWAAEQVATAGGEVRWILNDPKAGFPGRYIYDHSKWGVIDGQRVIVQSENWVRHGIAVDPSFGNRGWGALAEDPAFADYLTRVFEADWRLTFGDVQRFGVPPFGGPGPEFKPEATLLTGHYAAPFKALTVSGEIGLTPVLAPDHALLETGGVIGLLRSARSSILIEQQYVHPHWGPADGDPVRTPDLYLEEAIQAARRGVQVRILLSDAFLNAKDPKDNTVTVAYVNAIAQREGLNLEARLINSKAAGLDKIHNKGVVVDAIRVLISSINWSLNSPANNRELGIILEHPLIGRYFTDLFQYDWNAGHGASGVLIGGVDRGAGRVTIQNHGTEAITLAGWALATEWGRWALPAVTIPAGGTTRLGRVKDQLPRSFKLRPAGDRLRLLNGEQEVDAIEWGSAALFARAPLPPGTGTLCRIDGPDTNTALDWRTDCDRPK
ncbi:MAG TPA: phospholipase D-like domain-containing protein [Symbiobacteriaceae bacterium]|nr:phospholipase D-like domain-containing protein [Symbiobacteriaceae bacterium]